MKAIQTSNNLQLLFEDYYVELFVLTSLFVGISIIGSIYSIFAKRRLNKLAKVSLGLALPISALLWIICNFWILNSQPRPGSNLETASFQSLTAFGVKI